jgi:hypothetical protein
MAGLGAGSWGAGALIRRFESSLPFLTSDLCNLQLLIGAGALLVPLQLVWGHRILDPFPVR